MPCFHFATAGVLQGPRVLTALRWPADGMRADRGVESVSDVLFRLVGAKRLPGPDWRRAGPSWRMPVTVGWVAVAGWQQFAGCHLRRSRAALPDESLIALAAR